MPARSPSTWSAADVGVGARDDTGRAQLAHPELEPRYDSEVATAAADGPEQLRGGLRIDLAPRSVSGDEIHGEKVVDRQPVATTVPPHSPAKSQPTHSGVRDDASGNDAIDRDGGRIEVVKQGTTGHAHASSGNVDLHLIEAREVEHDAIVASGETCKAVTASANRQRESRVAGYRDGSLNIPHEDGRTTANGNRSNAPFHTRRAPS